MVAPDQPSVPSTLPQGAIPLVEPTLSHRLFVEGVAPPYVLVKITHARQLVKRGETADSYFGPDTVVITSTTVPDNQLFCLHWDTEIEILRDFEPDYHIPADTSVYSYQAIADRNERVRQSLRGFLYIRRELDNCRDEFSGRPPVLIPLLKGVSTEERSLCYRVFETYDVSLTAFYATQYFTGGKHARHYELVDDLDEIAEELPPGVGMFVIGTLGPNLVPKFPSRVRAVAGLNQWRKRVTPTEQSPEEMQQAYVPLAEDLNIALDASVAPTHAPEWSPLDHGAP